MRDKSLIIKILEDLPPYSNINLKSTSHKFKIKFLFTLTKRKNILKLHKSIE